MLLGVLTHGDGITFNVSSGVALDESTREGHFFLPYDALDPGSGVTFEQFAQSASGKGYVWAAISRRDYVHASLSYGADLRCKIGTGESNALAFERTMHRKRILDRLTPGVESLEIVQCAAMQNIATHTKERSERYVSQSVSGPGAQSTEYWRLSDLSWSVSSGDYDQDFPAYLTKRFTLARPVAWDFALVLVRGAYLGLHERNDALISRAEALERPVKKSGHADAQRRAHEVFRRDLRDELEFLQLFGLK